MQADEIAHPLFSSTIRAFDILQRVYMRAVAWLSPVADCPTVFGATMRCSARDFVQRRVRFFGVFEHNLTWFTLDRLRPGDIYLDIGANVGYFTLLASRRVGSAGKVVAVEAAPQTYRALVANLDLNDCLNVEARNAAATEKPCRISISIEEQHNSGANTIRIGDDGDVEGIPFRSLAGHYLPDVRFIKIDIEGSERPVLEAILDAKDEMRTDLIIASEISPASEDLVARFLAAGFRAHAIQNVYTIDYYLMRAYLARYGEEKTVIMFPVEGFRPGFRDYVFERTGAGS